ncbi:MAG: hypothetical protein Q8P24_15635 [Desulfobacterales bacterium]|nr:hypothetical protein [Desulfobacterales bacterium]
MIPLEQKVSRISAVIYSAISVGFSLIFLLITMLNDVVYTLVARVGGGIWVFILAMIITMPLVIPRVRKKYMG